MSKRPVEPFREWHYGPVTIRRVITRSQNQQRHYAHDFMTAMPRAAYIDHYAVLVDGRRIDARLKLNAARRLAKRLWRPDLYT